MHSNCEKIRILGQTGVRSTLKVTPPFVRGPLKCTKSNFNPVHIFPHFGTFCLLVLQLILAEFSDLEQFENWAANCQFASKYESYGKWLQPRAKCKKGDPH